MAKGEKNKKSKNRSLNHGMTLKEYRTMDHRTSFYFHSLHNHNRSNHICFPKFVGWKGNNTWGVKIWFVPLLNAIFSYV